MSAGATAEAGRGAAESLMSDTFTAYEPNGTTTVNEQETAAFTPKGRTSGRLRVTQRVDTTPARFVTIGGVEAAVVNGGLRIPLSAPVPEVYWEYQLVTAGPDTDPALVGTRWRVEGVQADSYATARRLNVVQVPQ